MNYLTKTLKIFLISFWAIYLLLIKLGITIETDGPVGYGPLIKLVMVVLGFASFTYMLVNLYILWTRKKTSAGSSQSARNPKSTEKSGLKRITKILWIIFGIVLVLSSLDSEGGAFLILIFGGPLLIAASTTSIVYFFTKSP